jgi:predicted DNA-binding transcriptional regulator YafY
VRAGRLIDLVALLNDEGRLTAAQLAQRLQVSERTVLRDIEVLSGAGVPVYATRGSAGGFQLLEGYRPALPSARGLGSRGPRTRMTVRITPEGRRFAAILGLLQPLRPRPSVEPGDEGWVTATCRMRDLEGTALEVLALGPHVEVLAPPELRDRVADLARRTARLYD